MSILIVVIGVILFCAFLKVLDAYVLPIYYCINGEINVDSVSFTSYIPFRKYDALRKSKQ